MPAEFPQPQHLPCPECGASVKRGGAGEHVCEAARRIEYDVIQLRPDLENFEVELGEYLETPRGRFELWYAERRRAA